MRIRNWREFQHYKDRNPPWIKLHNSLLASRDWVALDDASRVLAVACMLIAAGNGTDGEFPDDPDYIKRVAYLNSDPNFKPLIQCGFIEPSSVPQADASNTLAVVCSETEQSRGRGETEQRTPRAKNPTSYPADFIQFWSLYPNKKKKLDALKAWNQTEADRPEIDSLLDALGAQLLSDDWTKDGGQFIPHPASWLRAGSWDNETHKPKNEFDELYDQNGEPIYER